MIGMIFLSLILTFSSIFIGRCAESSAEAPSVTKDTETSEKTSVPQVVYQNAQIPGPPVVVLPGHFKSIKETFTKKFTPNNIADFAELELANASFKVLDRVHLGPLLEEIVAAVNLGDKDSLRKFKKGKFATTRWFIQLDILKAEPVAEAGVGFDGKAIGDLVTTLAGDKKSGAVAGTLISSVGGSEEARIWVVGIRYKIIDAATSEVVKTSYIEEKLEVGAGSVKVLGISHTSQQNLTIDSMVHYLVQRCVAEIDKLKGLPPAQLPVDEVPDNIHKKDAVTSRQREGSETKEPGKQKVKKEQSREISEKSEPIAPLQFEVAVSSILNDVFTQMSRQPSEIINADRNEKLKFVISTVISGDPKQEFAYNKRVYEIVRERKASIFPQMEILDRTAKNINTADYILTSFIQSDSNNKMDNVLLLKIFAVNTETKKVSASSKTVFYP